MSIYRDRTEYYNTSDSIKLKFILHWAWKLEPKIKVWGTFLNSFSVHNIASNLDQVIKLQHPTEGYRWCPFQIKHNCATATAYLGLNIVPVPLVWSSVLLQGPPSSHCPWLWEDMRLRQTNEAGLAGSTGILWISATWRFNAAHRTGIPFSHWTAAGFTRETVVWVAPPQSPSSLNYICTTGKVSRYLPSERRSSQPPDSVLAALSFPIKSVLPLTVLTAWRTEHSSPQLAKI